MRDFEEPKPAEPAFTPPRNYAEAAMAAWGRGGTALAPVRCERCEPPEHCRECAAGIEERALLNGAAVIVLACLALIAAPAAAQTDVDRLMRTAASECGIDCADDEIAALHLVIASTAEREGVRYRTAWRLLSPRLAAGTVSRAWVAHIDHRCEEPSGWPTHVYERDGDVMRLVPHAPWSAYRGRCEDLVRRVRLVLDGATAHRCAATPRSWGSEMDAARSVPGRRFVVVDCGETANVFGEWLPLDVE